MAGKREEKIYLYGKHALREALAGKPGAVKKVFLDKNAADDKEVTGALKAADLSWNPMKGDGGAGADAVHQGVIAEIDSSALYSNLDDVLASLPEGSAPCIVLLDELQDPHNVGAIIRSAAAFGASAVLLPEHHQAPVTGAVIKASAGMALRIPLVRIGNVNQTMRLLKEKGFWAYGLAMDGDTALSKANFDSPTLLVVGNEQNGIRQKTLELCDVLLSIPMDPRCESLNAAVAAGVTLYEWSRGR